MLRLSIEELCALNLVLSSTSVKELLQAAEKGFSEQGKASSISEADEIADLCFKASLTL